uniref:CRM1_C domain-containing protein n=1 Tax=Mesocestoides corti TaxID=53468 RepID=A0A5K3FX27_MESCO
MTTIVKRLGEDDLTSLPRILDPVFHCALQMISKDLEEYPEQRTNFFALLQAVNASCFTASLALNTDQFKLLLESLIWAIRHTTRQVSETGLGILHTTLENMAKTTSDNQQLFFHNFYVDIRQHVFGVVTNRCQTGKFTMEASLLACMLRMVEEGVITVALGGDNPYVSVPAEVNVQCIHQRLLQLLKKTIPHL